MRIRVLGCSGGIGGARQTTSFLIDDDILIDAGTGVGTLSLEEMSRLRHIFITHSHLDHVGGLPLLIDSVFHLLDEPVTLHARHETIEALKENIFNWSIWPDFGILPRVERPVMRYSTMEPGDAFEVGGRRFESIEVKHAVPCQAYYVRQGASAFAFSGDTTTNDTLWDGLNARDRLDALIVETAFPNADEALSRLARHYCPRLLAQDLAKLKHDAGIYISHLKPGGESIIQSELEQLITDRTLHFLRGGEVLEF